jgi:hypothetical protein
MPRQPVYPKGLEPRGKRLWREALEARPALGPGERVLLEEACRLADRLERLNVSVTGGALPEVETDDGVVFTLVTNAAQQEARLAVIALRQVLMSLGLDRPLPVATPQPGQTPPATTGVQPARPPDPLDEITRRREQRGGAGA